MSDPHMQDGASAPWLPGPVLATGSSCAGTRICMLRAGLAGGARPGGLRGLRTVTGLIPFGHVLPPWEAAWCLLHLFQGGRWCLVAPRRFQQYLKE